MCICLVRPEVVDVHMFGASQAMQSELMEGAKMQQETLQLLQKQQDNDIRALSQVKGMAEKIKVTNEMRQITRQMMRHNMTEHETDDETYKQNMKQMVRHKMTEHETDDATMRHVIRHQLTEHKTDI